MIRNATLAGTAVLFATIAQTAEPGFADPVLGRWDLTVESSNTSFPSWLEIRLRTEEQLMARLVGQFGSVRHATTVSYRDEELMVSVPVQYERGTEELVFTGSRRADSLIGLVDLNGSTLPWSGARAPSLKRDTEPTWGQPVPLIGSDLSGWRMRQDTDAGCWSVSDGILKATPPCVDIVTDREFDDFQLRLEFRYPPGSNSGVYLRGRYEVQIQDDYGKALDPLRLGGIYGFIAPTDDAARPAGEWQIYEIQLVGRRVTVILNGTEIISNREIPGITGGALDSHEGSPGPLMLQGDHGPIEYRNVFIATGQ
ncbi:MAG: DUF1080 domain-containing protein [Pseudomonadota bacterium]|nr:DUF1080 domain-containing protein [Pseudomonadota bacterium]